MQQAHGLLTPEERERWGAALGSAGILPGDDEREMRHYVGGYLNSSEDLAGEKEVLKIDARGVQVNMKVGPGMRGR